MANRPRAFLALGAALLAAAAVVAPERAGAADSDDWVTQLIARTDVIAAKVARLRGLALKRPIEKGVVNDDQLRARILARMDEDNPPARRLVEAAAAKRWGLVPWTTDLDALIIDLLTEQIAGFYDPRERKLYIASSHTSNPAEADMVMAHEIDHALQDQHFALEPWMKAVEDDADASAARGAVIEGDGMALMIEYTMAEHGQPPPWGEELVVRGMMALMQTAVTAGDPGTGAAQKFDRAPLALREQMIFPYRTGIVFIAALRRTQPWRSVDDVFRKRPPASTEQVMHPELYLSDARPDVITAAPPPASLGLTQLNATTWGEASWGMFLRAHGVASDTATSAAAGWGGDRVVLLGTGDGPAHPERTTAVAVTSWDTEVDGAEAWDALGKALEQMVIGAALSADDDQVRWLDADGRITAAERRGDRIAIVVGAPLGSWRALLDSAWTWKIKRGARP